VTGPWAGRREDDY